MLVELEQNPNSVFRYIIETGKAVAALTSILALLSAVLGGFMLWSYTAWWGIPMPLGLSSSSIQFLIGYFIAICSITLMAIIAFVWPSFSHHLLKKSLNIDTDIYLPKSSFLASTLVGFPLAGIAGTIFVITFIKSVGNEKLNLMLCVLIVAPLCVAIVAFGCGAVFGIRKRSWKAPFQAAWELSILIILVNIVGLIWYITWARVSLDLFDSISSFETLPHALGNVGFWVTAVTWFLFVLRWLAFAMALLVPILIHNLLLAGNVRFVLKTTPMLAFVFLIVAPGPSFIAGRTLYALGAGGGRPITIEAPDMPTYRRHGCILLDYGDNIAFVPTQATTRCPNPPRYLPALQEHSPYADTVLYLPRKEMRIRTRTPLYSENSILNP